MSNSLYIHIPFCKRRCIYCDFYSTIYEETSAISYVNAICSQIKNLDRKFSTIYIGGGTPTALNTVLLEKLLNSLNGSLEDSGEFTIEINPESFEKDKAKLFIDHGINRISMGFQSLKDRKLKTLGRVHNSKKAYEALTLARNSGFKNISIDLIFGVWGEDLKSWTIELEEAVKLSIQHISCYSLTYEKGTPIWEAAKNKSITPLDEDSCAAMYERAIDILSLREFKQYEVSNFAKEGYESRHNLNYWNNNEYTGLGPSAASYLAGVRSKNVSNLSEYIRSAENGQSTIQTSEKLSPIKRARETAAIKIRTKTGINFEWFKTRTGFDFMELEKKALPQLLEDGFIKYIKKNNIPIGIALKQKGFLFCDTVSSALL